MTNKVEIIATHLCTHSTSHWLSGPGCDVALHLKFLKLGLCDSMSWEGTHHELRSQDHLGRTVRFQSEIRSA